MKPHSPKPSALSRRDLLKTGLAFSAAGLMPALSPLAASSSTGKPAPARADAKPNILLLMTDQQRWDCLGAAGNRAIDTPHMDRLAHEGAIFTHAYSSIPSCTPARAALLTGMAPWKNGMLGYGRVGEHYPVEMPQALRDAGYYTLGIGKMHWHPQRNLHGFHRTILDESGREETINFRSDYRAWLLSRHPDVDPDATGLTFNDYRAWPYTLPEDYHPTSWTGATACQFLRQYDRAEPFFLKVSFARPHNPYDPPARFFDKYANADLPAAAVGDWVARYAPLSEGAPDIWHGDVGAAQVRTSRQGYYGNVSFIDEQIGRILTVLEERGLLDDTLILFTSDHGDMLGDQHLWRKTYAYEGSAHVPFLVRWPQSLDLGPRGCVREQPVEMRDILPTFMEAAGVAPPPELDGQSVLPLIADPHHTWREFIDLEHSEIYGPENHWTGLTDGRRKYIFHCASGEEQFFDLEDDPLERVNLASDAGHGDELELWRARMIDHLAPRGEAYVRDGRLAIRTSPILYSPNYPGCACHPGETNPYA